jgi:hypothetical protein
VGWGVTVSTRVFTPGAVRAAFAPLGGGFVGRRARQVGLACLLVLAIWCGVTVRVPVDAGLV